MLRCKTTPLSKEQTHDYILKRLKIAGAGEEPIFSPEAMDAVHIYSLGIPRVVNLLCEHSLVNAYVDQQRPIKSKVVEDVAREFQLDEVEPIAPTVVRQPTENDVYNSEAFIQNLGEALSRFRISPSRTPSRERK
jgi:general secretion pathway protein A